MKIERVSPERYADVFTECSHVFNTVAFNELNRHKCEDIHYLIFNDEKGKTRMGIILGEKGEFLKSPFSAPFGGFEEKKSQKLTYLLEAIKSLKDYARKLAKKVVITFPSDCYDAENSKFTRQLLSAFTCGAELKYSDYNYHYILMHFHDFKAHLDPKARNKLSSSEKNGLSFQKLVNPGKDEIAIVYSIIKSNHEALGYPLHLTIDDIIETYSLINMDFFLLKKDEMPIVGAVVYHTSRDTVQLIYWGDLPGARALRPMNFMAYNILGYYYENRDSNGLKYFDLGPASSEGIPALGLCDFKEGLGCTASAKVTVEL